MSPAPHATALAPTLYVACGLPLRAGGELVNFQHVAGLRRQGWRAAALLDDNSRAALPAGPPAVPMVLLGPGLQPGPADWLVLPEVTPPEAWARLAGWGCRLVVHNQNPYYSFRGFANMAAMNAAPLAGGLACSHFTAHTLQRWGSRLPWQVVRPALLPHFAQAAAQQASRGGPRRQVAVMPRKRPADGPLLQALLRSLHPALAEVPWVVIDGLGRAEVAQALAESQVFVALSHHEGLGLPPLEAMAAGCLVLGFDGGGGQEYATPDNGLWVADGDVEALAHALARALQMPAAERQQRVAAGQATAAAFSQQRFDAELHAAWLQLLGAEAPHFRLTAAELAATPQLIVPAHA